ncbi:MAG: PAS domain S-box protein [Bacteroidales bacterium]|nr:PAS domain S-box protein [Bacteroidales bacterium]
MSSALKILFAEDLKLDYELALKILEKEFKVESVLVKTAADFKKQLIDFKPDLVISDYRMSKFNGLEALKLTKEFDQILPFIVLTASRDEEIAVECMRLGASDYVLKENIQRLPSAVREAHHKCHELREKEAHFNTLLTYEERFKVITESSRDVLFISDLNLNYNFVSPGIEYLTGYSVEESLKRQILNNLPDEDQKKLLGMLKEELENELAGKNPKDHFRKVQFRQYHKEGHLIWVEAVVRFLHDEQGKPKEVFGVARDITEQKALQNKIAESESFLNFSQEIAGMGGWDYDLKREKLYWSENNYRLLGLEPFSIEPDNEYFHARIHSEDLESVRNITNNLASDSTKLSYEFRVWMPDGSLRYFLSNAIPVFEQGELVRLKGINLDITDRKKQEQALIDSNFRLKLSLDATNQGIYDHNLETEEIIVSENYARMLGFDPDNFVETHQTLIARIHPEDIESVLKIYSDYLEGKIAEYRTEFRQKTNSGAYKWFLSLGRLIDKDDPNKPTRMLGSHIDIDFQKLNEEKLIESEERFKLIFENAPIGLLRFDENAIIENCNEHFVQIIGSPIKKLIGLDMRALDDPNLPGILREVLQGKTKPYSGLYPNTTNDKKIQIKALFAPVFDNKKVVIGGIGIVEDVSSQLKAQQKLLESEERFSRTFYSSPIPKAILKFNSLEFFEVNNAFCRFSGYRASTIKGNSVNDLGLIEPEILSNLKEKLEKNQAINQLEVKFKPRKEGAQTGLVSIDSYIQNDEKFLIVAVLDITERKRSEEELLKLTRAVEQSPISILITDLNGNIEYVNPWISEITGYLPGELIGKNPRVFSSGHTPAETYVQMYQNLKKGLVWQGEFLNKKKNGSLFWEKVIIGPVISDMGVITHYLAVKEDISLVKELSESLKENEKRYKNLFQNNPLPMFIYDNDTLGLVEVNNVAIEKYGYSIEEFQQITIKDLHPPAQLARLEEHIKNTSEKYRYSADWQHKSKSGEIFDVEIVSHVIPSKEHQQLRLVLVNDITEKLKAENTLIQAKAMAEASDRLKTNFLNNISHEVRTPLNGIMGASSLLDDMQSDSDFTELVEIIHESSDRLIQTITDFMDISLLTSGNMEVYRKPFDFREMFEFLMLKFKNRLSEKAIELEHFIPETNAPIKLNTDQELLSKAIGHLLLNAFKFTNQGKIFAAYKLRNNQLEIEVRDTGIGIAKENFDKIFEYFTQEDQSSIRRFEGSGLGLSIVSGIMKLLDGKVKMESEMGVGSCFTLILPLAELAEINVEADSDALPIENPTVLVAEDEDSNFLVLEMLMRKMAVKKVMRAYNGKQAVDMCANNEAISLVLMDIKMPVMDGLEATRIIKKNRPELPVIAITAYAMSGDETTILESGCDDYVSKPISIKVMMGKMKKFGL